MGVEEGSVFPQSGYLWINIAREIFILAGNGPSAHGWRVLDALRLLPCRRSAQTKHPRGRNWRLSPILGGVGPCLTVGNVDWIGVAGFHVGAAVK